METKYGNEKISRESSIFYIKISCCDVLPWSEISEKLEQSMETQISSSTLQFSYCLF